MNVSRETKPSRHLYQGAPYVRSEQTDIRKTFERFRKAQRPANVTPLKKVKA